MNFIYDSNKMSMVDNFGREIGYIRYVDSDSELLTITKVYIDENSRGRGYASKMMDNLASKIKNDGKKAYGVCTYAINWFKKSSQYQDLYVDIME